MKLRKISKSTASRGSRSRSGVKSPNPRRRAASRTGGGSSSDVPRLGRWTCYHGEEEEEKPWRPPADKSVESIEKLYIEAARRLPLEEIPELVDGLGEVGYCFGLADPVSNIILNAIAHLASSASTSDLEEEEPPPPPPRKRTRRTYSQWWGFISFSSFSGLLTFMKIYFRYLTDNQARHYLYLASYDLLLAIKLVHQDRCLPRPSLLPDGGKMKTALRIAALQASHPAPDDLAQTMTAQYPSHLLSPIMDKLRGSELLTTHDVWAIRDLLLTCQCLPPNMDFLCCPNGDACAQPANHGTLQLATCIGGGAFARISTEIVTPNHVQSQQLRYISDLTFDSAAMEMKLSKCMADATTGSGGSQQNYDFSPPCEYILSLKMCLLDTIHGFYIRALAALPLPTGDDSMRRGCLLRALLVSGHCYGPLDPVSNIILNAVLYDAAYPLPLPHEGEGEVELPYDIFDTRAMSRMASCSLDGLIALLGAITTTTTTTGAPLSKHEAVEYLWSMQCDLTEKLQQTVIKKKNPYTAAAKASKHPQHTMLGSLLVSLSGEKLDHLRYLLRSTSDGSGCVISSADWEQLNTMIKKQLTAMIIRKELLPFDPQALVASSSGSAYLNPQSFARTKLEELLLRYSRQHPWEPRYKLDLICGVEEPKSRHCRCYHANFLASAHGSVLKFNGETTTAPTPVRTLFFAEFWDDSQPPGRFYESHAKPICCPVQDYCTRFGRCTFCDEASTIVHPPCSTRSHPIRDYNVNAAIRGLQSNLIMKIWRSLQQRKNQARLRELKPVDDLPDDI